MCNPRDSLNIDRLDQSYSTQRKNDYFNLQIPSNSWHPASSLEAQRLHEYFWQFWAPLNLVHEQQTDQQHNVLVYTAILMQIPVSGETCCADHAMHTWPPHRSWPYCFKDYISQACAERSDCQCSQDSTSLICRRTCSLSSNCPTKGIDALSNSVMHPVQKESHKLQFCTA